MSEELPLLRYTYYQVFDLDPNKYANDDGYKKMVNTDVKRGAIYIYVVNEDNEHFTNMKVRNFHVTSTLDVRGWKLVTIHRLHIQFYGYNTELVNPISGVYRIVLKVNDSCCFPYSSGVIKV